MHEQISRARRWNADRKSRAQARADVIAVEWKAQMAENERLAIEREWGPVNQYFVCPHCAAKGTVRTKTKEMKAGVSGGKVTGAVLTGGVSLLATGLSRMERRTRCLCERCNIVWFA
jgi:hypothetical protein